MEYWEVEAMAKRTRNWTIHSQEEKIWEEPDPAEPKEGIHPPKNKPKKNQQQKGKRPGLQKAAKQKCPLGQEGFKRKKNSKC